MSAIRLARGFTGRDVIVKFAGCYHGHVDALLASAGSGVATFALPDSAGVPRSSARRDDRAALQRPRRRSRPRSPSAAHEIAAVITEAAAGNMGVVPPAPGFTEGLLRVTEAHGALLVSDEVMTGFRCSASGFYGLEGPYAAGAPDLFTFGKVMGGGFPTAAFGGRADVMALLAPQGPVYQAGTLSGNPVASAAGLATLQGCTPAVYDRLDVVVARHRRRRRERADAPPRCRTRSSGPARCSPSSSATAPSRTTTTPRTRTPTPSAGSSTRCSSQGVHLPPSAFESWFVSASHDDEAVDHVLAALPAAARAAATPD